MYFFLLLDGLFTVYPCNFTVQIPLLFSVMSLKMSLKVLESSISDVCTWTACTSRKLKENTVYAVFLNCLVFISTTFYHHFLRCLAVEHLATCIQTDQEGSCLTLTLCSHSLGVFKLFIPLSNLVTWNTKFFFTST